MGDCMRSYKRSVERAEMEASKKRLLLSKRRKSVVSIELQELALASPADVELDNAITAASATSDVVFAGDKCCRLSHDEFSFSSCFSNGCCDVVKDSLRFVDLKAKSFETEISTCINVNSQKTTPLTEEEMKSPPSPAKQPKTPSQEEIDEFFTVAENYEQKRFMEKYNYDIVKDMAVDGRYQWVRLKP
ncbi:hypothetical protein ES319_D02G243500v1 [Gossypium barbadense]|uniref:Cyclin-dependent kinase inhibitor domain-containing protein n=2 Tax=Gossypium TaxID=3633 RepID=A0A5J5SH85_GOSBA|nr:hypothetical protein ES319_D02G243500v1 [Gossypium barbadense]TYG80987.1 hypothetical protein ES288_D02G261200v1 [Gossypium darwinii]